MEKLKGIAFALGLLLIVFFSGCVKVNIEHEIKSDGTNEMNIKYDFAELYDMGKSAYSSTSQPGSPSWADAERQMDQNMEKSCSDVKKQFAEKTLKENAPLILSQRCFHFIIVFRCRMIQHLQKLLLSAIPHLTSIINTMQQLFLNLIC